MSAVAVLNAARAAGVHLEIDGDDLVLEAVSAPPAAVLDALSRHKPEVMALLRPAEDGWSAEDWLAFFDERASAAEFSGGVSRKEAEARAFGCCVVKWLDRHPAPSPPGRCAWCGGAEKPGAIVVPLRHRAKPPHVAALRMLPRMAKFARGRRGRGTGGIGSPQPIRLLPMKWPLAEGGSGGIGRHRGTPEACW